MANQIDTLLSKGRGKIKAMKARLEGVVGVFKTLTEQHGEVESLLGSVRHDADKRQALWPKIRTDLLAHCRAEVQEVFPVLRAHEPTRALADQHDTEAREIEQLVAEIDATEISCGTWGKLFDRLADTVEAHANEEETEIFPIAQSVLGPERSKQLDARFLAAQQRIAASLAASC
jgi:hemerythrin superfamily protein